MTTCTARSILVIGQRPPTVVKLRPICCRPKPQVKRIKSIKVYKGAPSHGSLQMISVLTGVRQQRQWASMVERE